MYISTQQFANLIGYSKYYVCQMVKTGRVVPRPIKAYEGKNAPYLFDPKAKIVKLVKQKHPT